MLYKISPFKTVSFQLESRNTKEKLWNYSKERIMWRR